MWILILGIIVLIAGLIYVATVDEADGFSWYLGVMGTILAMAWVAIEIEDITRKNTYKEAQIDALKGNYKYEQTIKYEQTDTGYVPVDTVYVKIKSKE